MPGMNPQHLPICTQLRDHLDAEAACYRRLLGLAERKQRELIANDMTGFTALVQQEQAALDEVSRLRQVRDRLTKAIATLLNLKEGFRMGLVLEKLPDALKADLVKRRAELAALMERLKTLNERNALLIRQSLGLVRDILGALMGPEPGAGGYDRRGLGAGVLPSRGGLINLAG